ncbi:hypothetical protein G9F71_017930 [Clostridium sp. FP2]|uniref:hypothetical protein n=1 Tax=Clostridium sp. FP2 TaxID=2724481 RepID=UPI0013E90046|nr:hypothetical protein [Clostridium sp. FP2]MBZ9624732.1 hypothetical protein [Clostridium sp. FP2]
MKLNKLADKFKIDWTNFLIIEDCRFYNDQSVFDISSKDFLTFAKGDYYCSNKQGLINALSNAKRAIDCQVDWIITYLGYDYLKFNGENYPNINNIIGEFESQNETFKDIPYKLKFVQSMEIAPAFLVSKIRSLRNKLEHEYAIPKKQDVKEAVEIAELFINATENIVRSNICSSFQFGSNFDNETLEFNDTNYYIDFDITEHKNINIRIFNSEEKISETIIPTDEEYVFFIKAMVSHEFRYLAKAFGKTIDNKHIKYIVG